MVISNYKDYVVRRMINDIEEGLPDVSITYEVWATGYDVDGEVTEAELLLGTFEELDAATQYAAIITFADIKEIKFCSQWFSYRRPIRCK